MSSGKLQSSSTLKSESDTPVLNLGAGTYHLVAVAGIEDCEVPEQPTINSTITLPKDSLLQQPLQMGSADISVSKSTTVTITLYNQVTAINIALTDIPDDVSACHVSFSLMHNSISYGGKLSGTTVNTI
ncbi:MAG: FimB/Mfa2 family fimbrial subunit, partial [Bacteroidaceae bacterium]|nr:FimB/Mfa2 family fimbrial subunit [Bacteroidaceae bacterium]